MSSFVQKDNVRPFVPWIMWGVGALFFFSAYFFRVSPGVMSIQLMTEFHTTALVLGGMASLFYYPYVLMQIPAGIFLDRFGPRRLLFGAAMICMTACFLFSMASSLRGLSFGRLLFGFGASFAFVGALKLAGIWFSARRIGLIAGLTQALGMLGATVGERPVAILLSHIGWRETVMWMGAVFILLSILIITVVRDRPKSELPITAGRTMAGDELWLAIKKVFSNPQSWIIGLFMGLIFTSTEAFAEMWGDAFLIKSYGIDMKTAAMGVGFIFLGWAAGGPILGALSDKLGRRKPFMIMSAIMTFALMSIILYTSGWSLPVLFCLLFLFGICNSAGVVIGYAIASEHNPSSVIGTSLGMSNMFTVLVGASCQPLIGWILDVASGRTVIEGFVGYSLHNFRMAITVLPITAIFALILSLFFIKETYCKPLEQGGSLNHEQPSDLCMDR